MLTNPPTFLPWGVFNVKVLVGALNQEKALVGALSMIVNLRLKL